MITLTAVITFIVTLLQQLFGVILTNTIGIYLIGVFGIAAIILGIVLIAKQAKVEI